MDYMDCKTAGLQDYTECNPKISILEAPGFYFGTLRVHFGDWKQPRAPLGIPWGLLGSPWWVS